MKERKAKGEQAKGGRRKGESCRKLNIVSGGHHWLKEHSRVVSGGVEGARLKGERRKG